MERKLGFFENLRNNIRNGWKRLTSGVSVIVEEKRLEMGMIREAVAEMSETHQPGVDRTREVWNGSGINFGERLANTARDVWHNVQEGWVEMRGHIGARMEQLQERYHEQGFVGATTGIVAEAAQNVGQWWEETGARINMIRVGVETVKLAETGDRQANLDTGIEVELDQFRKLNLVGERVEKKRTKYAEKWQECMRRLDSMQRGRDQFVNAKRVVASVAEAE